MDIEVPIQIDFLYFQENRPLFKDHIHVKSLFFKELIQSHLCFQEKQDAKGGSKWYRKQLHMVSNHRKTERPKIGNRDLSKESIFKKEFTSMLNKLTESNLQTFIRQTRTLFHKDFLHQFVAILLEYLKRQPEFQSLYIQILESIYPLLQDDDVVELNRVWSQYWEEYMRESRWMFARELVEQSHNYDDFCEYIKEKKTKNAYVQAWARLIKTGTIRANPLDFFSTVIEHCYQLDMTDKIDKTVMDSYIDQLKEFYKLLPKHYQEQVQHICGDKIEGLKELEIGKAGYFKLIDFIEILLPMKKSEGIL